MVKNLLIVVGGLIVISLLYAVVVPVLPSAQHVSVCTEEAMICRDGSTVGRTGPNCEFAKCPVAPPMPQGVGTIRASALVGPTCPVERVPPDPACADRPYEGDFVVTSGPVSKSVRTDEQGMFTIDVPPGTYTVASISARAYPRCSDARVEVVAGQTADVSISCDTGIR